MSKQTTDIQRIIDEETEIFKQNISITEWMRIPSANTIPIEKPTAWIKIPEIIACFVDMEGSTRLSAGAQPAVVAKAYRYFTNTAVRIFDNYNSPYIDVKGDGVFALFDKEYAHTALAAVISFKTFVREYFTPKLKNISDQSIGGHFGIDKKTVMVRKLGLKFANGRNDRQNEVWAGKPINMAAKLSGLSSSNTLWVSDRFFKSLKGEKSLISCGCGSSDGNPQSLWDRVDLSQDDKFDFDEAWVLKADWCQTHGEEYCRAIVRYDAKIVT